MGILCRENKSPLKLTGYGTFDLPETFMELVVPKVPDTLKIFTALTGGKAAAEVIHHQAAGIILVINLSTRAEP